MHVHIHITCLLTFRGIDALQRETEVEILNYAKKIKELKADTGSGKSCDRRSAIYFAVYMYIFIHIYIYMYTHIESGKRSDGGSAISFA